MKKLKTLSLITQNLLFILYIPLSIYSWLMGMASEGAVGAANGPYIFLTNLVSWLSIPISLFFFAGMIQSLILRGKGEYGRAILRQFLPPASFLLNCGLAALSDLIPKMS